MSWKFAAATAVALTFATVVHGQEAGYDASSVLATVDGTDITLGHLIALRQRLPQEVESMEEQELFAALLDQLVDQTLIANSKSTSVETDPLSVRLGIENERRAALAGVVVQEMFAQPLDEAKLQEAYDASIGDQAPSTEFNASHILLADEATAEEVLERVEAGDDFAELARQNSTGPSGPNGGELGWFGVGAMVPEFETAVAAMEVGDVSEPVQTQFGWHLIKLNDKRVSEPLTLEQFSQQIEPAMRREQLQEVISELRSGAEINLNAVEIPFSAIQEIDLLVD